MVFEKKFFEEEEREGFLVPELMKRAWAAEMEVLEVVADICNRREITYYAIAGTLLGAVRHQGFVPWDDDIDIALKRPDYNHLISLLKTELPEGFALGGMYAENKRMQDAVPCATQIQVVTDGEYWGVEGHMRRFHGFPFPNMGIDIFPLDYMPRDLELSDIQKVIIGHILLLLYHKSEFSIAEFEEKLQYVETLCSVSLVRDDSLEHQLLKLCDAVAAMYTSEESDYVTIYSYMIPRPNWVFKKEWFDSVVKMPFENTLLPVPQKYHEILTQFYGDYQIPVQGTATHDYPVYKKSEKKLKNMLEERGISLSVTEFCRNFAEKNNRK